MKKLTEKITTTLPLPKVNIAFDAIFAVLAVITFLATTLYIML